MKPSWSEFTFDSTVCNEDTVWLNKSRSTALQKLLRTVISRHSWSMSSIQECHYLRWVCENACLFPDSFEMTVGIPVLSGTWANVLWKILIAIVGGKGKEKAETLAFFSICLWGNAPDGLSLGLLGSSCFAQLESKSARTCQTHKLTLCWRLKFNRLLLINMSKPGQPNEPR